MPTPLPLTITCELGYGSSGASLKVVLLTQRGYLSWVFNAAVQTVQSFDLAFSIVSEAIYPDILYPTTPPFYGERTSAVWTLTVTQVGSNLRVDGTRVLTSRSGPYSGTTDTQSGTVTVVNAIAAATPLKIFPYSSPNPIVQIVDAKNTFNSVAYFGTLAISKAGRNYNYTWDAPPTTGFRKFVSLGNGAATPGVPGSIVLDPAWATDYFPGYDTDLPVYPHYPQWRCIHYPDGAEPIYPSTYVLDWHFNLLTGNVATFPDLAGRHHVYFVTGADQIMLSIYEADLAARADTYPVPETGKPSCLNAFRQGGQPTYLFYIRDDNALIQAVSLDDERTFTVASTGILGYALAEVVALPLDNRVLAMLHSDVDGDPWYVTLGTWDPVAYAYGNWTAPVSTGKTGTASRGSLARHHDGMIVFSYFSETGYLEVIRTETVGYDGTVVCV